MESKFRGIPPAKTLDQRIWSSGTGVWRGFDGNADKNHRIDGERRDSGASKSGTSARKEERRVDARRRREEEGRRLRKAHMGFDSAAGSTRHVESRQWWIRFYSARPQAMFSRSFAVSNKCFGIPRSRPTKLLLLPRSRDPTCGSDASGQRDHVGGRSVGPWIVNAFLLSERRTENGRTYQYVDWGT